MKFIVNLFLLLLALDSYSQDNWKNFVINDLQARRVNTGKNYLAFLSEESFNMGLYELKAGSIDNQPVHEQDEIYYILSGKGKLTAQDSLFEARPGSIFYVRAGIKHRFIEIEEDLSILVVFSKTPSNPGDPDANAWNMGQLRTSGNDHENTWNQFLFLSTMRMGLYQLPSRVGGDEPMTHKVDEINIITKGSANFHVGNDEIPVSPGSLVWVSAGSPHSFSDLSEDFDVLIIFQVK